jgi:ABC-type sugar transport system permease subunit
LGWSLIFAFGTLGLQTVIGLLAALLLNELKSGYQGWMSAIIMSPYFAAAVAGGVIMKWFLSPDFGLLAYVLVQLEQQPIPFLSRNILVHISLIVAQAWHDFAYAAIIYLAALQGVPPSLYEAASMDGATRLRRFRDVTIPYLLTPTIIILATRTAWNLAEFAQPYEMTEGGPGNLTELLSILIYNVAYIQGSLGRAYSIGMVMALISVSAAALYIIVIQGEEELYA